MKSILSLICLVIFVSCNSTRTTELTPSFEVLKKNYPILEQYKDSLKNVLTIDYKEDGMKFNVFSTSADLHLLTVEFNGKTSAIPIMPLSDSCYWKYENYSSLCNAEKNNFKSEYERLLDDLDISDSSRSLIFQPYGIIVLNILDFAPVIWHDTIDFLQPCFYYPTSEDSIRLRQIRKLNTTQIIKLMNPSPNIHMNYAYKSYYGHVFWFDAKRPSKRGKWHLIYNSWIFNCPQIPIMIL